MPIKSIDFAEHSTVLQMVATDRSPATARQGEENVDGSITGVNLSSASIIYMVNEAKLGDEENQIKVTLIPMRSKVDNQDGTLVTGKYDIYNFEMIQNQGESYDFTPSVGQYMIQIFLYEKFATVKSPNGTILTTSILPIAPPEP